MRAPHLAIVTLAATFLVPLSTGDSHGDCESLGPPALGIIEISPADDARATFYVDDRNYLLGSGIWVYQESNGLFHDPQYGDLQRGGSSFIIPDDNEICEDDSPNGPDQLLY